jgi:hypothetical protein
MRTRYHLRLRNLKAYCTELERPPERRDHQSPKVTRLTSSRPRMAQSYTKAN